MPWKLNTPFVYDHGDGHPSESYTHIKMVHQALSMEDVERTELALHLRYGTMVTIGEKLVFISGKKYVIPAVLRDIPEELDGAGGLLSEADPQLSIFIATQLITSDDVGKRVYDVLKERFWQRLVDDGVIQAGEIE